LHGDAEPDKHDRQTQLRAGDPDATPGAALLAKASGNCAARAGSETRNGSFSIEASALRRTSDRAINVDVIFPVLHGTFGETARSKAAGTGGHRLRRRWCSWLFRWMDKDVMKSLFQAASLPIVKTCHRSA